MKTTTTVQFKKWNCILVLGQYNNGRTAIQLKSSIDGSPVAVATINVPDVYLEKDEVIIKDYSENEGMLDTLVSHGIVEPTGRRVKSGFIECEVCKLVKK